MGIEDETTKVLEIELAVPLIPYWSAWTALSAGRTFSGGGMGLLFPNGLLYQDLSAYARDHGFDASYGDLTRFVRLVQAVDGSWIEWWVERSDKKKRALADAKEKEKEREGRKQLIVVSR